jgi:hypothetical protein
MGIRARAGRFAKRSSSLQRPTSTGSSRAGARVHAVVTVPSRPSAAAIVRALIALHAWGGVMGAIAGVATIAPHDTFSVTAARATTEGGSAPRPFEAPLARSPLDGPLVLNGGFGEYRSNHFHAGLDLGTGGRVGRPVHAPLSGWIERMRASGVGYGRSLYLHADDGRLIVFGHLDAYAPRLAAYVEAAQESTGQYEQDLWPEPHRFRVAAGERIAWSGESGAGGPHLHIEIRRGDMAYHPLRAGLAVADTRLPALTSLTLEPLDDASYVERGAAPFTHRLGVRAETLRVEGRVRAIVGARKGLWNGVDRMVPWSTVMEFGGERVECRFDSVSWATDMVESDYLYDADRVVGDKGIVMWAPAGFRPRVLLTTAPESVDAGTIVVRRGDPPRAMTLTVRDLRGAPLVREVVLRPPGKGEAGPDTTAMGGRAEPDSTRWFEVASLPDGFARITFRGASASSRRVTIGGRSATLRDGDWSAVIALPRGGDAPKPLALAITGQQPSGDTWSRGFRAGVRTDASLRWDGSRGSDFDWSLERHARFEAGPILYRWEEPAAGKGEFVPRSRTLDLMPTTLPLRRPLRLEVPERLVGPHVGLFADDGSGWSWLSASLDAGRSLRIAETRHLGRFALFEDTLAPRIVALRPPQRVIPGPYSSWALQARLSDAGSGIDARASWFEVDGRRVPSEWDSEARILRWRPVHAPAKGSHRFTVVAADRAGNQRRDGGRFAME